MYENRVYLLFSGGLDSIIAAKLLKDSGHKVIGVYINSPFFQKNLDEVRETAENLGIELKILDVGNDYLEMLKHPFYGYGKNVNPCIDCKAYMLTKVKEMAGDMIIATGEVLGQRPMSQHLNAFKAIEKLSKLKGRVLRPLSGKLLPPTVYEETGMIDREKLLDLRGRSRKRYPEILKRLGLELKALPTPAGGCLLTEPSFAKKVKDLMNNDELSWQNVRLLRMGRHFRIGHCKLVVGRNREENKLIREYRTADDILIVIPSVPAPTAILRCKGEAEPFQIETAAAIVARYSDAKERNSVDVLAEKNGKLMEKLSVKPLFDVNQFAIR